MARSRFWIALAFVSLMGLMCVSHAVQAQSLLELLRSIPAPREHVDAVTVYGDIDNESAAAVVEQIHDANKSPTDAPLPMYIDSPGGSVVAGNKIIDAMMISRRPIHTIDVSVAASMAAIIHSYGVKRYMFPHAVVMLHWAHAGIDGDLPRIASRLGYMQAMIARHDAHICKVTNISPAELQRHEAAEWYLLADEALARHVVDKVVVVRDYPTH